MADITKEDIDKAADWIHEKFDANDYVSESEWKQGIQLTDTLYAALTEYKNRHYPQPLTLDELKQMIGLPIFCSRGKCWGVLGKKGERIVVGFSYGWEWIEDVIKYNHGELYRYEPVESEE